MRGSLRELGPEQQIGDVVTETVSAPDPAAAVPVDGAQAAPDVTFTVPAGLDRLDADMIWPDATNSAILSFTLIDPQGRLRQISYDYGSAATASRSGSVPDIQHVEVANPEAGTWRAEIKWANGRSHLQEAPNVPGTYTGPVKFKVSGQNWITTPVPTSVSIAAHRSAVFPFSVAFPQGPGDHPESLQLTADDGAATSVPISRRTLIPSAGGEFDTEITSTVGRGIGQISTFNINVPSGRPDLGVTLTTADASADDPMTLFLVNPLGTSVATHTTTSGGRTRTVNGVPLVAGAAGQTVTFHVPNPMAGTWEIDVELNLTTSGQEFTQTVVGDVLPQAPAITSPVDGTATGTQTPTVSGTGTPGDTVTVWNGSTALCQAPVGAEGTWSCTTSALTPGSVTLTATQADATGDPSAASAPVDITVPATATVALALDPVAPTPGQAVTLTATTTNVPDGTTVAFADGATTLGTGTVTTDPTTGSETATLALAAGLAEGSHTLTASVPATDTSLAAVSAPVDVRVGRAAATITLHLTHASVAYGHAATGTVAVGGANGGTARVTLGSTHLTVRLSSAGTGSFTLPATLAVGQHTVTAMYDGSDTLAPSTVSAVLTVTKAPTTTSLTASRSKSSGSPLRVAVRVGGHAGGAWPTGAVTVRITLGGRTTSDTRTLHASDRGAIVLTLRTPSRSGAATIRATYAGDHNYTGSSSTPRTVRLVVRR